MLALRRESFAGRTEVARKNKLIVAAFITPWIIMIAGGTHHGEFTALRNGKTHALTIAAKLMPYCAYIPSEWNP